MPDTHPESHDRIWNVPNQVTLARVALSVVLFALLSLDRYREGLVVFILAAGTDWVDGYWARKYGQVTKLGRVLDPFADKLVICGTYAYLAAAPRLFDGTVVSGVYAWMCVVIVARELLVTTLRSFIEGEGGDFSARWAGKWKMVFQCLAACLSLYTLTYLHPRTGVWKDISPPDWLSVSLTASIWAAIVLTVLSAVGYVQSAWRQLTSS